MNKGGTPLRELYFIDRGPGIDAIERARASHERGDTDSTNPDRNLVFTLSPTDGEEPFTATLVSRRMILSGDNAFLIYGSLKEDSGLPLRAIYRLHRGRSGEFGTVEEVEE